MTTMLISRNSSPTGTTPSPSPTAARKQQRQRSSHYYYYHYPFLLLAVTLTGYVARMTRNDATSYYNSNASLIRRETTEVPNHKVILVKTNQQQQPPPPSLPKDEDDDDDDDDTLSEQSFQRSTEQEDEQPWDDIPLLKPEIVWLASYPNSGTSYTMTMVERATNRSTASNYGAEVTYEHDDSIPIYPQHPQGPFWEGLSGKLGRTIRPLADADDDDEHATVLVKTHCGGRCIKCTAHDYVVDLAEFRQACQRTTGYRNGARVEQTVPAAAVAGVVHLIRNPLHNTVARFHLERRNMVEKETDIETRYPVNATGFGQWCRDLDRAYGGDDAQVFDAATLQLFAGVPCHAEF